MFNSWGSGANPWGPEKEDQFSKPNHWDGMLEVVGVTGVVHLGQIQSGLRSAMRIAQVNIFKINLSFFISYCQHSFCGGPSVIIYIITLVKLVINNNSPYKFRVRQSAEHNC